MTKTANEWLQWVIEELNAINPWDYYNRNFFTNEIASLQQAIDRRDIYWTMTERCLPAPKEMCLTWQTSLYHAASQLLVYCEPGYRLSSDKRFREAANVLRHVARHLGAERPDWMAPSWPTP